MPIKIMFERERVCVCVCVHVCVYKTFTEEINAYYTKVISHVSITTMTINDSMFYMNKLLLNFR